MVPQHCATCWVRSVSLAHAVPTSCICTPSMCSFSRSVFHQTPKHCRSSAFLWGTIHISRSVNHDLAQNDAEDAPPPVLDTGGLDVDVPGGSDVKFMIIDMQLHGGPGEQLPGLAWLGFVCFTILANKPANSVKFPSTQAVPGRQWNVQIQSQSNPGNRPIGSQLATPTDRRTCPSWPPDTRSGCAG